MNILVVGAGATGGYFGGRLAEHGADVRFLLRPGRVRALEATGLVIRSPLGNVTLRPLSVTADRLAAQAIATPFDLVIVGCKAFDLEQVITDMAPVVGQQTLVLPLLNGLGHLDRLDAAFGRERVLGAVCYISATTTADGAIEHLNQAQDLIVGSRTGPENIPAHFDAAFRLLGSGGFRVRRAPDVMQEMWEKLVFIATIAAATTLARGSIGQILETRCGHDVMMTMFDECGAVAAAHGHALRPKAVETTKRTITQAGSAFTASMLRDLLDGRRLEADAIIGDLIRRAAAQAVPVPSLRAAFLPLELYEARSDSAPGPPAAATR